MNAPASSQPSHPSPAPRRTGTDQRCLEKGRQLNLAASALDAPAAEFGGVEFYPEFPMKAAVLCSHLIKHHPLPDGNKRVGFLCTVEFAERNGYDWESPAGDEPGGEETVKVIEGSPRARSPSMTWRSGSVNG